MLRYLTTFAALCFFFSTAAFADEVRLRPRVEASGRAVTLGDLFEGAGAVSGRAVAPAPPPGQVSTLSVPVVAAAAQAAGLQWTPPADLANIRVVRPAGMRATLPAVANPNTASDASVRRGQSVTVVYLAPGLQMTTQLRALEDGAVGQTVRLATADRTVDAIVTGPAMARAVMQ